MQTLELPDYPGPSPLEVEDGIIAIPLLTKADTAAKIIRPTAPKMMTLADFEFRTRPRDHDGHRECVDKGHRGACKRNIR